MHRVFLVPEVVGAIVESGGRFPGFLYTCLLVNRLFFQESCRLLWYGCGSFWKSAIADHTTASIRHLVEISEQSQQRAQVYANLIQILHFGLSTIKYPYVEEARWHDKLSSLQFPQLRQVRLHDSKWKLNKGDAVMHYAQPNVTDFCLARGSQLSDLFLHSLYSQCPRLNSLEFGDCTDNTVTKEGFIRFLQKSKGLICLHMRSVFKELWSQDAFRIVEQYPKLEALALPSIEEEWLDSPVTGFRALQYLSTSASNRTLELLAASLPSLGVLELELHSPCRSISAAADCTRLGRLQLEFPPDSNFHAQELLLIAQSCPELESLVVSETGDHPTVSGLSDELMEQIAHNLPNIKTFILKLKKISEPMKMQALRSLGKHCLELHDVVLAPFKFDWNELNSQAGDSMISKAIWTMRLKLYENQQLLRSDDEARSKYIVDLGTKFHNLFPQLIAFFIEGGGQGERYFIQQVTGIGDDSK